MKYRRDNKKLLLWGYTIFIVGIITSLIINVLNTKNVFNMYIIALVFGVLILSYIIFYPIYIKVNKKPLQLEDNYLDFYVSFNKKNKAFKLSSLFIDILELALIVSAGLYYIYKMQFDSVYEIYPLIGFLLLIVVNLYIIIRDIIKLNTLDRIDAFQYGFESYTKQKEEQVLPEADIDNSLSDLNGYVYEMVDDNDEILGGCIVNINHNTNINHLDFLFVKVGIQSKGMGQVIWKEI